MFAITVVLNGGAYDSWMLRQAGVLGRTEIEEDPTEGSFKNLAVWRKAVEMGLAVYRLTSRFPASEQYGLTSQLRRAAVSVASNIAEGYGRATRGEYLQFLGHARGSNSEAQTQMVFARELGLGAREALDQAEKLSSEVGRMLTVLMRRLRT